PGGAHDAPLPPPGREHPLPGSLRRRQDAPGHGSRAPGHRVRPPRLLPHAPRPRPPAPQGEGERPPRGPPAPPGPARTPPPRRDRLPAALPGGRDLPLRGG